MLCENTVLKLTEVYFRYETWHENKLNYKNALVYFKVLLLSGNILVEEDKGLLVGYLEFYRVNNEQLQRLLDKNNTFHASEEDITNGNICYVANAWVRNHYRNSWVFKKLQRRCKEANKECVCFTGEKVKFNKRLDKFKVNRLIGGK